MSSSVKIRQLKSKISDLQSQYQHLLPQRQQDIAALITSLDLASMEDTFLVGGLMFIKDKVAIQDPIVEGWRKAGERFLRQTKSKNFSSFTVNSAPQKANRSSQKQPESGGE